MVFSTTNIQHLTVLFLKTLSLNKNKSNTKLTDDEQHRCGNEGIKCSNEEVCFLHHRFDYINCTKITVEEAGYIFKLLFV